MLHRAVEQFLTDVYWGDLDFLLVDLPPGTGDVAISLGQLLPGAKSIVVTTPQATAATVAERSGAIGLTTGQEILGVVENMSYLEIAGSKHEIFGSGGADSVAKRLSELSGNEVPVLGRIPIGEQLRAASDRGEPLVALDENDPAAAEIIKIAERISQTPRGLGGKKLDLKVI